MSTSLSPDQAKRILRAINDLKNTSYANKTCIIEKSPFDDDDEPPKIIEEGDCDYIEVLLRLLPTSEPFKEGAFPAQLLIPIDFPLRPPKIKLLKQIHHPNIEKEGLICLRLLRSNDEWNATTTLAQIVKETIEYIDTPNIQEAQSTDIATEYRDNRKLFNEKARALMKKENVLRN